MAPHLRSDCSFSSTDRILFKIIPTTLALLTSISILLYISTTSKSFSSQQHEPPHLQLLLSNQSSINIFASSSSSSMDSSSSDALKPINIPDDHTTATDNPYKRSDGINFVNEDVFHDEDVFTEDYKEMNRSFKMYVYPHKKDDPYANVFLPVDFEPGGNYASESYFKKVLMQSHFITRDPSEADLFFLPFSIAVLRHDQRVGVAGIPDFVRSYIHNISQTYPYWNRSGGTDHFYVACHSVGRSAMDKAEQVKFNAIQVVCSSSYFVSGYIAHKDASMPQIWPRKGDPPNVDLSNRKKLAFFAGAINSPIRKKLLESWGNDSEIFVHYGRLPTPYADELLGSKFCFHVKGYEVNTARIGDALYYGCVPVIIANHYDLPFADILDWKSFSIVVATSDIPLLKEILHEVSLDEYITLQRNVLKVRKHFQWSLVPVDYDAFYMVMYELWLRRTSMKFSFDNSIYFEKGRSFCTR